MVFVWVELESEFPVRLLQVVVSGFFVHTQNFIIILTTLYSAGQKHGEKDPNVRFKPLWSSVEIRCFSALIGYFLKTGSCATAENRWWSSQTQKRNRKTTNYTNTIFTLALLRLYSDNDFIFVLFWLCHMTLFSSYYDFIVMAGFIIILASFSYYFNFIFVIFWFCCIFYTLFLYYFNFIVILSFRLNNLDSSCWCWRLRRKLSSGSAVLCFHQRSVDNLIYF